MAADSARRLRTLAQQLLPAAGGHAPGDRSPKPAATSADSRRTVIYFHSLSSPIRLIGSKNCGPGIAVATVTRTLHPLPRCSHSPLCPDSTTASAEKRHGRRDGSAHRAGRLGRRVMAMTIRAEVWRSVQRGDEERCPRVAVALGLLVRPRRTGQSGRGGARGRHVTLFQRRCWFGMSAGLSWPVSAARGGSDGIGMLPRAPAAAPLSRRTGAPRPTCASPFSLLGTCSELAKLTAPLLVPPPLLSRRYWIVLLGSRGDRVPTLALNKWELPGRRCAYFAPTVCRPAPHRAGETAGATTHISPQPSL